MKHIYAKIETQSFKRKSSSNNSNVSRKLIEIKEFLRKIVKVKVNFEISSVYKIEIIKEDFLCKIISQKWYIATSRKRFPEMV